MRWFSRDVSIAAVALGGILIHVVMRWAIEASAPLRDLPLQFVLLAGGGPLVVAVMRRVLRGRFDADILALVSIVASAILQEYVAGAVIVLMLSGGSALEQYATRRASSVLEALAARMPHTAHRVRGEVTEDVPASEVGPGDELILFPHEACPVDGVVLSGHGSMNEAYLTGEPYLMAKLPGAAVLSGALNGETALTIRASKPAADSRYAQILKVVRETEQNQPAIRRLAERLGAWYTPVAIGVAAAAGVAAGDAGRFLAVIVVATPCPLLIAIPVAVIGAISRAAKKGILIRKAAALENIDRCRVFVFDKTGTLTYGRPSVSEVVTAAGYNQEEVLRIVGTMERYSRHPLAAALVAAAAHLIPVDVEEIHELPGKGLTARAAGHAVEITGRRRAEELGARLPEEREGLECCVFVDGQFAALIRFRDTPRADAPEFVRHLSERHGGARVVLLSGDRESEVRYLASLAGIQEIYFGQSPEEKVRFVEKIAQTEPVLYVGDGINDAPALLAATVGVALGDRGEIAVQAADAAILEPSLRRVDELIHIGRHMRKIALQSAVGGMGLSLLCMGFAAAGHLTPTAGALAQEAIDILAVLNALRVGIQDEDMTDY